MEEIVKGGVGKVSVLLLDLGDGDSVGRNILSEGSLLSGPVIGDLGNGGSEAGGTNEGHNVGVMGKGKNGFLGSLVPGGRSDSDGLSSSQVGELKLEGKSVPGFTGGVLKLELVGVFVKFVNVNDLGNNIEVVGVSLDLVEGLVHVLGDTVVGGEVGGSPLSEGGEESSLVLLEGSSLSRVSEGDEIGLSTGASLSEGSELIGGEEGP